MPIQRSTSPKRPSSRGSNASGIQPLPARVDTWSTTESERNAQKIAAGDWAKRPLDPETTIGPHPDLRKSASAGSLPQVPSQRTPQQYGGVSTGLKFDPRQRSPPRAGLEDIRTHFGGPSRQGSGDTTAGTIASLSKPSQTRNSSPPTAVKLARGSSPAPQTQNFQLPFADPSDPAIAAINLRRGQAIPKPQRSVSANNAADNPHSSNQFFPQQTVRQDRRDTSRGRGQRTSSSNLRPPEMGRRSRSDENVVGSLLNFGSRVWNEGALNMAKGRLSGQSSREGSRNGRRSR